MGFLQNSAKFIGLKIDPLKFDVKNKGPKRDPGNHGGGYGSGKGYGKGHSNSYGGGGDSSGKFSPIITGDGDYHSSGKFEIGLT